MVLISPAKLVIIFDLTKFSFQDGFVISKIFCIFVVEFKKTSS